MTIKIPDNYMGKPIKGSLEKVLASAPVIDPTPAIQPSITPPTPANINDPENYIILPGKTHGTYSYPDLVVSMEKFYQGKNWNDSHKLLNEKGDFMLTTRQYVDFLSLLKGGTVYDGTGEPLNSTRIEKILDEIITVRNPWRSEWLDAKFESVGGVVGIGSKMYINYEHTVDSTGTLKPGRTEQLEPYLASDKKPGIDVDQWLRDATVHGLPKPNVANGALWYWYPRSGQVAGFYAYSVGAYLYCDRDPTITDSSLGVRAARKKI